MRRDALAAGVVILREAQGNLHLIGTSGQKVDKLLQAAHRFCTRWVRLDI